MATESGKGVVTTRTTIEAVERLEGAVQARLRQMSKGRLRELIPRAIDGRFRLCIPPMDDDDDLILSALIDEVFALREQVTALRPLLDASPLWVYRADDVGILACKHCDGMEEGDVFIHHPRCPWQVAKRSHDSTTEPKN